MSPKDRALSLLKARHHAVYNEFVVVTTFLEKEFDLDDHTALKAVYDHWHQQSMSVNLDMLHAIDEFMDLFESGLDNVGEREDVIMAMMDALRAQFLKDYAHLRLAVGDYSDLLSPDGALKPEIKAKFERTHGPMASLSAVDIEQPYHQALKEAMAHNDETKTLSFTVDSTKDQVKVSHFGDHLALSEFFEK